MQLDFDIDNLTTTEFGVGRDTSNDTPIFKGVPSGEDVKEELVKIAKSTIEAIDNHTDDLDQVETYSPSEKYASTEYLVLPLDDPKAHMFRNLYGIMNLSVDSNALDNVSDIFCYFTRFTDNSNNQMIGLRRASQFKSISKKKILGFRSDSLSLVDDPLFALNGCAQKYDSCTKIWV